MRSEARGIGRTWPAHVTAKDPLRPLMLRVLDGDAAAQAELLRALSGHLRVYFARRLGGGAAEVEDLVQDTLVAIHFKRHTYDPGRPFGPWAYAVARYKLMDHFRRTGVRAEAPLEAADSLFEASALDASAAALDVARLLASLSPRQRAILTDVKVTGLTVKEASDKAGVSLAAGKVIVHRAMKALARSVGRED